MKVGEDVFFIVKIKLNNGIAMPEYIRFEKKVTFMDCTPASHQACSSLFFFFFLPLKVVLKWEDLKFQAFKYNF
jgi:hypothetical protein